MDSQPETPFISLFQMKFIYKNKYISFTSGQKTELSHYAGKERPLQLSKQRGRPVAKIKTHDRPAQTDISPQDPQVQSQNI